ncbi:hypothetical protein [Frigidibacter sp. ROC022]|uniref:hypothetical protein n=1 Tax=Frigidibacter sp. ROC022 TaxID=2971796 RepID=UPI00215AFEA0|nr:hypothetical protein [Frigidibacter sp. ROC022]MCR8726663.1 hypothetical protein [Frigidibacter sp. ROC022]
MSEPMTNIEIEDVLSSIRRLVSEDSSEARAKAKPTPLMLTPALRIADPVEPVKPVRPVKPAEPEAAEPGAESEVAAAPEPVAEDHAVSEAGAQAPDDEPLDSLSADAEAFEDEFEAPEEFLEGQAGQDLDNWSDESVLAQVREEIITEEIVDEIAFVETADAPTGMEEPQEAEAVEAGLSQTDVAGAEPTDAELAETDVPEAGPTEAALAEAEVTEAEGAEAAAVPDQAAEPADSVQADADEEIEVAFDEVEAEAEAFFSQREEISLEDRIADLEAAIGQSDEEFEPDGSEDQDPHIPQSVLRPAVGTAAAEAWDVRAEPPVSDLPEAVAEQEAAAENEAEAPADADAPRDDGERLVEEALIDEDSLRDIVAELVRQELRGELGERITRNVRRLIRREIHRALALQTLEEDD